MNQDSLICYKVGTFVNCYGKDAYILSYLFNYKIKSLKENMIMSGFPRNAIPKVTSKLQKTKINYLVIDVRNNYDVDEKEDYKNLNTYIDVLEQAQKGEKIKVRIRKINEYLLENKETELIRKIEELINEN